MQVSISHAKAQLTDLVRRAEEGEEVVLTRHGHATVRLTPIQTKPKLTREEKRRILDDIRTSARAIVSPGADAAHAADFLYGENGLPE